MTQKYIILFISTFIFISSINKSSFSKEMENKQICIATTEIFPAARAQNDYPNYEFSDLTNGETIGYLGVVLIDHENKKIEYNAIESEFSEFATKYKCMILDTQSAYRD